MEKRYKVKLNSVDNIEELLQEVYNECCRQIVQIQNEIDKLSSNINLGTEGMTIEDKTKYSKAVHDLLGDKEKATKSKFEVAKFMGELIKHCGDIKETLEDQNFIKATSLNIGALRNVALEEDTTGDETTTYYLRKQ